MAYKIVNMWVPQSMYRYKSPYAMKPNYLVIHNTANTATARNEVAYMRRNTNQTSYHVAIDEKEVVQAIPFNRNAWHTGDGNDPKNSGNRLAIGIEICRSMDNGYSGAKSSRYSQAEENAALYAAHVLHQFGWGTDRLRQHWHYTRKDCPHKMRAHNSWGWFVKRVQQHLDALKGGKKKTAKAPAKPKASGSTYTVRKNDSLWAIAKANGTTVANLKKWNGLKSNVIKVGQKLNVKAPAKKSSTKKTPYTIGEWKTNKYGTQYIKAKGTFTVGSGRIMSRFGSPFLSAPEGGYANPGWSTEYSYLLRQDGHIWIEYYVNGRTKYLPVKTWDPKTGKVGTDWGTYS